MKRDFLEPRLVGERFDDHTIPLEMLRDISVFEEFVVAVAKWLFLKDQPERQRVPKGFSESISIKLSGVLEGSAIPKLEITFAEQYPQLFPAANEEYFFQARDAIISAIDAAERNQSITQHLPEDLLGYFDRLGRSLREGESFEFRPNTQAPARLNKAVRRRLVLASRNETLTEEVTLRGSIPEVDQGKMTFELQIISGPKVPVKMDMQHLDTVLKATTGFRENIRVSVSGIATYDRYQRLKSVEALEQISLIENNDPLSRLDELRALENGWLDGKGLVPSLAEFEWMERFITLHITAAMPSPFLFLTAEGGFQAEWMNGDTEISLEVFPHSKTGELHAYNHTSEIENFLNLDLSEQDQISSLQKIVIEGVK
jgi:hypothetical protein